MGVGAAGGEPERASVERIGERVAHRSDVGGGRVGAGEGAVAHHVDAERVVGHLAADVEGVTHAVERVHVRGERLPLPRQALGERGARDVLDALHQRDQPLAVLGPHRREADAARAHDRGGHPVEARRREVAVPARLAVGVRVQVDEAGRDPRAVRVEGAARGAVDAADGGDDAVADAEVTGARGAAGAVDQGPAADDQVEHGASRSGA